jgi:chaperone required for assembly of F1-ATPase
MSMRDLLDQLGHGQADDPTEAARRAMRPKLVRRFYASTSVSEEHGGFSVLLDGKPIKTPARRTLAVPGPVLARAVAAEWEAQSADIDPANMPLTRLVNTIIDGVGPAPAPVAAEVAKYLGSDLLFYRADSPEGLVERQAGEWDPIIEWAHWELNARFILSAGISFVPQPEPALAHARAAIPEDPWLLGPVHSMMTLTGSALLALAVLLGRVDVETAWRAAHVDEDWNIEHWGTDELALKRRKFRHAEMLAAATVIEAIMPGRGAKHLS